jgi:hypothetical protein
MDEKYIALLNSIAQELFGVNYNQLGTFGKWEVEDKTQKQEI